MGVWRWAGAMQQTTLQKLHYNLQIYESLIVREGRRPPTLVRAWLRRSDVISVQRV